MNKKLNLAAKLVCFMALTASSTVFAQGFNHGGPGQDGGGQGPYQPNPPPPPPFDNNRCAGKFRFSAATTSSSLPGTLYIDSQGGALNGTIVYDGYPIETLTSVTCARLPDGDAELTFYRSGFQQNYSAIISANGSLNGTYTNNGGNYNWTAYLEQNTPPPPPPPGPGPGPNPFSNTAPCVGKYQFSAWTGSTNLSGMLYVTNNNGTTNAVLSYDNYSIETMSSVSCTRLGSGDAEISFTRNGYGQNYSAVISRGSLNGSYTNNGSNLTWSASLITANDDPRFDYANCNGKYAFSAAIDSGSLQGFLYIDQQPQVGLTGQIAYNNFPIGNLTNVTCTSLGFGDSLLSAYRPGFGQTYGAIISNGSMKGYYTNNGNNYGFNATLQR